MKKKMLVVVVATLIAAFVFAVPAWAKSYSMPQVDIDATLHQNGDLTVSETRTFELNGSFECVYWQFDNVPLVEDVFSVQSVTLTADGESQSLSSVAFLPGWRTYGGPGTRSYSVDTDKNGVYVFFGKTCPTKTSVTINYTMRGLVDRYTDINDFYWQYIGTEWAVSSNKTTATLHLPVPQGTAITAGDNVRAWGHGSLSGKVTIEPDGSIVCTNPVVSSGSFSEMRVDFPRNWLDEDALVGSDQNYAALDGIVAEETVYADSANAQRLPWEVANWVFGILAVVLVGVSLILFFRFGREHKPDFHDEYWRDVPDANVHPLLIRRIENWNKPQNDDLSIELLHLCACGAVRVDSGSYDRPIPKNLGSLADAISLIFNGKPTQQTVSNAIAGTTVKVEDHYLTRLPEAKNLTNPIDLASMELLFDTIGGGRNAMWFDSIMVFSRKSPRDAKAAFERWQMVIDMEMKRGGYIETPGVALKKALRVVGSLAFFALFMWMVLSLALGGSVSWSMLAMAVAIVITQVPISRFMPRRSKKAATLHAKAQAMRKWIHDFTLLKERPTADVEVWGHIMVYAAIFGLTKELTYYLKYNEPEVFEASCNSVDANWGAFCSDSIGGKAAAASALSSFSTSLLDSFASWSSGSGGGGFSSSSSSGGGGGGGFSGGGGGGGGGHSGGGGGAR